MRCGRSCIGARTSGGSGLRCAGALARQLLTPLEIAARRAAGSCGNAFQRELPWRATLQRLLGELPESLARGSTSSGRQERRANQPCGALELHLAPTAGTLCEKDAVVLKERGHARGLSAAVLARLQSELLEQHRVIHYQTTEGYAEEYARRRGIEGTVLWAVRACGLRRARYRGLEKVRLDHALVATALDPLQGGTSCFTTNTTEPDITARFLTQSFETSDAGIQQRSGCWLLTPSDDELPLTVAVL